MRALYTAATGMAAQELNVQVISLDIAIRGEGFFKIQMPDGTYTYSRDGSFQMDAQGRVVTAQGNPVQPTITIPQNASGITINAQGQLSVTLPDGIANTDGFGDMQQSNLEQANVEVVSEISDLIAAQRAYEMNAKVVSAADQMLQSTANLFR